MNSLRTVNISVNVCAKSLQFRHWFTVNGDNFCCTLCRLTWPIHECFICVKLSIPSIHFLPFIRGSDHSGSRFSRAFETSLSPSNAFQLLLRNPQALSSQMSHIVPPACSGSAPGSPASWTCLDQLQRVGAQENCSYKVKSLDNHKQSSYCVFSFGFRKRSGFNLHQKQKLAHNSDPNEQKRAGDDSPLGSRVGQVGEKLVSHSWQGFPPLNRGPCLQRLQLRGLGGEHCMGGWKHLQPECGNQLLNLSQAVGRHGNSGRPWLALSNPAVPREELNC